MEFEIEKYLSLRENLFSSTDFYSGALKAEIRGTDGLRAPIRIDQQGTIYMLSFTPTREGNYELIIQYDGNPLPNMPIHAVASSSSLSSSEHTKVEVHGRGSFEAKVNEEAEFTIDASKISASHSAMPVVRLSGVQADIEVRIRQVETNIFRCSYTPQIPGKQSK